MTSSRMRSAPCGCGDLAQAFEVARVGRDGAGVADDRLDDDAGDVVAGVRRRLRATALRSLKGRARVCMRGLGGDAGGTGDAEGGDAAAGLDQQWRRRGRGSSPRT